MKILTAKDFRSMPWKNGGGTTLELLRFAGGDDYDFRVSIAQITQDGPFSFFPGFDRFIVAMDGNGLTLSLKNRVEALRTGVPFFFSGDEEVYGLLKDGQTAQDFNLIFRRSKFQANTEVLYGECHKTVVCDSVILLYTWHGSTKVNSQIIPAENLVVMNESQSVCQIEMNASSKLILCMLKSLTSGAWHANL